MQSVYSVGLSIVGGALLSASAFLMLPYLNRLHAPQEYDVALRSVDIAMPRPELDKEEPPVEPEAKPEEVPELAEVDDAPPPSWAELTMASGGPGSGAGVLHKRRARRRAAKALDGGGDNAGLPSLSQFDRAPRPIYRAQPMVGKRLRKRAPATVNVIFMVTRSGRVKKARVESSTDPAFESVALSAIRKWRFEPGQRAGKAIESKVRIPITFVR